MSSAKTLARHRATKSLALIGTATLTLALGALGTAPSSFGQGRPARSAAGSSSVSKLDKIAAAASAESKATFKLTYTSSGGGSSPSTITIEQKPPEQLFKTSSGGEAVYNGKKAYYCSSDSGSHPTCIIYPSIGESPIAEVVAVYSAGTYVQIMQSWETLLGAGIAGVHISFSSQSFAGQASQCVTWSYNGSKAKYCVTNSGVLAYVGGTSGKGSSSTTFELTYYSSHVKGSDFSVPKGAKITSL